MAKILIADDSTTDLEYLTGSLRGTAHEILTAKDGEEAEEKVRTQGVDLVILDVIMPKKNGFQVCRDLKKDEKFSKIPIILVSSKTGDSDKFWGKKQGADEYITKPFEPVDILLAVKKHLGGAK